MGRTKLGFAWIKEHIRGEGLSRDDGRDVRNYTSGMDPMAAVNNMTGRSFIPGTSPKGNWAKKTSPGSIHWLPVVERVDVLP